MNAKVQSTMALLSTQGHAFLDKQVATIKENHGVPKMGRAVLIRGIVDAVAKAGISLADCTDDHAVSKLISSALKKGGR